MSRAEGETKPAGVRYLKRLIVAALALVTLCALLTAVLFIWPHSANVNHADAVIIPSGDHGERLVRALQLIHGGVASTLVFDGAPDSSTTLALCQSHQEFETVCLRPQPDGTRYEARAFAMLASARRWKTIVVVTSTQHVTRAQLLFARCVRGNVRTIGANPDFDFRTRVLSIAHEWIALIHSLTLSRGC